MPPKRKAAGQIRQQKSKKSTSSKSKQQDKDKEDVVNVDESVHDDEISRVSEANGDEEDEEEEDIGDRRVVCVICRHPEKGRPYCLEGDFLVTCSGCKASVHKRCYGLIDTPSGSSSSSASTDVAASSPATFQCDVCASLAGGSAGSKEKFPPVAVAPASTDTAGGGALSRMDPSSKIRMCVLCGQMGNVLKRTLCGQFVHVSCALWLHRFARIKDLRRMTNIELLPAEDSPAGGLTEDSSNTLSEKSAAGVILSSEVMGTPLNASPLLSVMGGAGRPRVGSVPSRSGSVSAAPPMKCLFCGSSTGTMLKCAHAQGCSAQAHVVCFLQYVWMMVWHGKFQFAGLAEFRVTKRRKRFGELEGESDQRVLGAEKWIYTVAEQEEDYEATDWLRSGGAGEEAKRKALKRERSKETIAASSAAAAAVTRTSSARGGQEEKQSEGAEVEEDEQDLADEVEAEDEAILRVFRSNGGKGGACRFFCTHHSTAPTYCLCRQPFDPDDNTFMLACDSCNDWVHVGTCVPSLEEGYVENMTTYQCKRCVRQSRLMKALDLQWEQATSVSSSEEACRMLAEPETLEEAEEYERRLSTAGRDEEEVEETGANGGNAVEKRAENDKERKKNTRSGAVTRGAAVDAMKRGGLGFTLDLVGAHVRNLFTPDVILLAFAWTERVRALLLADRISVDDVLQGRELPEIFKEFPKEPEQKKPRKAAPSPPSTEQPKTTTSPKTTEALPASQPPAQPQRMVAAKSKPTPSKPVAAAKSRPTNSSAGRTTSSSGTSANSSSSSSSSAAPPGPPKLKVKEVEQTVTTDMSIEIDLCSDSGEESKPKQKEKEKPVNKGAKRPQESVTRGETETHDEPKVLRPPAWCTVPVCSLAALEYLRRTAMRLPVRLEGAEEFMQTLTRCRRFVEVAEEAVEKNDIAACEALVEATNPVAFVIRAKEAAAVEAGVIVEDVEEASPSKSAKVSEGFGLGLEGRTLEGVKVRRAMKTKLFESRFSEFVKCEENGSDFSTLQLKDVHEVLSEAQGEGRNRLGTLAAKVLSVIGDCRRGSRALKREPAPSLEEIDVLVQTVAKLPQGHKVDLGDLPKVLKEGRKFEETLPLDDATALQALSFRMSTLPFTSEKIEQAQENLQTHQKWLQRAAVVLGSGGAGVHHLHLPEEGGAESDRKHTGVAAAKSRPDKLPVKGAPAVKQEDGKVEVNAQRPLLFEARQLVREARELRLKSPQLAQLTRMVQESDAWEKRVKQVIKGESGPTTPATSSKVARQDSMEAVKSEKQEGGKADMEDTGDDVVVVSGSGPEGATPLSGEGKTPGGHVRIDPRELDQLLIRSRSLSLPPAERVVERLSQSLERFAALEASVCAYWSCEEAPSSLSKHGGKEVSSAGDGGDLGASHGEGKEEEGKAKEREGASSWPFSDSILAAVRRAENWNHERLSTLTTRLNSRVRHLEAVEGVAERVLSGSVLPLREEGAAPPEVSALSDDVGALCHSACPPRSVVKTTPRLIDAGVLRRMWGRSAGSKSMQAALAETKFAKELPSAPAAVSARSTGASAAPASGASGMPPVKTEEKDAHLPLPGKDLHGDGAADIPGPISLDMSSLFDSLQKSSRDEADFCILFCIAFVLMSDPVTVMHSQVYPAFAAAAETALCSMTAPSGTLLTLVDPLTIPAEKKGAEGDVCPAFFLCRSRQTADLLDRVMIRVVVLSGIRQSVPVELQGKQGPSVPVDGGGEEDTEDVRVMERKRAVFVEQLGGSESAALLEKLAPQVPQALWQRWTKPLGFHAGADTPHIPQSFERRALQVALCRSWALRACHLLDTLDQERSSAGVGENKLLGGENGVEGGKEFDRLSRLREIVAELDGHQRAGMAVAAEAGAAATERLIERLRRQVQVCEEWQFSSRKALVELPSSWWTPLFFSASPVEGLQFPPLVELGSSPLHLVPTRVFLPEEKIVERRSRTRPSQQHGGMLMEGGRDARSHEQQEDIQMHSMLSIPGDDFRGGSAGSDDGLPSPLPPPSGGPGGSVNGDVDMNGDRDKDAHPPFPGDGMMHMDASSSSFDPHMQDAQCGFSGQVPQVCFTVTGPEGGVLGSPRGPWSPADSPQPIDPAGAGNGLPGLQPANLDRVHIPLAPLSPPRLIMCREFEASVDRAPWPPDSAGRREWREVYQSLAEEALLKCPWSGVYMECLIRPLAVPASDRDLSHPTLGVSPMTSPPSWMCPLFLRKPEQTLCQLATTPQAFTLLYRRVCGEGRAVAAKVPSSSVPSHAPRVLGALGSSSSLSLEKGREHAGQGSSEGGAQGGGLMEDPVEIAVRGHSALIRKLMDDLRGHLSEVRSLKCYRPSLCRGCPEGPLLDLRETTCSWLLRAAAYRMRVLRSLARAPEELPPPCQEESEVRGGDVEGVLEPLLSEFRDSVLPGLRLETAYVRGQVEGVGEGVGGRGVSGLSAADQPSSSSSLGEVVEEDLEMVDAEGGEDSLNQGAMKQKQSRGRALTRQQTAKMKQDADTKMEGLKRDSALHEQWSALVAETGGCFLALSLQQELALWKREMLEAAELRERGTGSGKVDKDKKKKKAEGTIATLEESLVTWLNKFFCFRRLVGSQEDEETAGIVGGDMPKPPARHEIGGYSRLLRGLQAFDAGCALLLGRLLDLSLSLACEQHTLLLNGMACNVLTVLFPGTGAPAQAAGAVEGLPLTDPHLLPRIQQPPFDAASRPSLLYVSSNSVVLSVSLRENPAADGLISAPDGSAEPPVLCEQVFLFSGTALSLLASQIGTALLQYETADPCGGGEGTSQPENEWSSLRVSFSTALDDFWGSASDAGCEERDTTQLLGVLTEARSVASELWNAFGICIPSQLGVPLALLNWRTQVAQSASNVSEGVGGFQSQGENEDLASLEEALHFYTQLRRAHMKTLCALAGQDLPRQRTEGGETAEGPAAAAAAAADAPKEKEEMVEEGDEESDDEAEKVLERGAAVFPFHELQSPEAVAIRTAIDAVAAKAADIDRVLHRAAEGWGSLHAPSRRRGADKVEKIEVRVEKMREEADALQSRWSVGCCEFEFARMAAAEVEAFAVSAAALSKRLKGEPAPPSMCLTGPADSETCDISQVKGLAGRAQKCIGGWTVPALSQGLKAVETEIKELAPLEADGQKVFVRLSALPAPGPLLSKGLVDLAESEGKAKDASGKKGGQPAPIPHEKDTRMRGGAVCSFADRVARLPVRLPRPWDQSVRKCVELFKEGEVKAAVAVSDFLTCLLTGNDEMTTGVIAKLADAHNWLRMCPLRHDAPRMQGSQHQQKDGQQGGKKASDGGGISVWLEFSVWLTAVAELARHGDPLSRCEGAAPSLRTIGALQHRWKEFLSKVALPTEGLPSQLKPKCNTDLPSAAGLLKELGERANGQLKVLADFGQKICNEAKSSLPNWARLRFLCRCLPLDVFLEFERLRSVHERNAGGTSQIRLVTKAMSPHAAPFLKARDAKILQEAAQQVRPFGLGNPEPPLKFLHAVELVVQAQSQYSSSDGSDYRCAKRFGCAAAGACVPERERPLRVEECRLESDNLLLQNKIASSLDSAPSGSSSSKKQQSKPLACFDYGALSDPGTSVCYDLRSRDQDLDTTKRILCAKSAEVAANVVYYAAREDRAAASSSSSSGSGASVDPDDHPGTASLLTVAMADGRDALVRRLFRRSLESACRGTEGTKGEALEQLCFKDSGGKIGPKYLETFALTVADLPKRNPVQTPEPPVGRLTLSGVQPTVQPPNRPVAKTNVEAPEKKSTLLSDLMKKAAAKDDSEKAGGIGDVSQMTDEQRSVLGKKIMKDVGFLWKGPLEGNRSRSFRLGVFLLPLFDPVTPQVQELLNGTEGLEYLGLMSPAKFVTRLAEVKRGRDKLLLYVLVSADWHNENGWERSPETILESLRPPKVTVTVPSDVKMGGEGWDEKKIRLQEAALENKAKVSVFIGGPPKTPKESRFRLWLLPPLPAAKLPLQPGRTIQPGLPSFKQTPTDENAPQFPLSRHFLTGVLELHRSALGPVNVDDDPGDPANLLDNKLVLARFSEADRVLREQVARLPKRVLPARPLISLDDEDEMEGEAPAPPPQEGPPLDQGLPGFPRALPKEIILPGQTIEFELVKEGHQEGEQKKDGGDGKPAGEGKDSGRHSAGKWTEREHEHREQNPRDRGRRPSLERERDRDGVRSYGGPLRGGRDSFPELDRRDRDRDRERDRGDRGDPRDRARERERGYRDGGGRNSPPRERDRDRRGGPPPRGGAGWGPGGPEDRDRDRRRSEERDSRRKDGPPDRHSPSRRARGPGDRPGGRDASADRDRGRERERDRDRERNREWGAKGPAVGPGPPPMMPPFVPPMMPFPLMGPRGPWPGPWAGPLPRPDFTPGRGEGSGVPRERDRDRERSREGDRWADNRDRGNRSADAPPVGGRERPRERDRDREGVSPIEDEPPTRGGGSAGPSDGELEALLRMKYKVTVPPPETAPGELPQQSPPPMDKLDQQQPMQQTSPVDEMTIDITFGASTMGGPNFPPPDPQPQFRAPHPHYQHPPPFQPHHAPPGPDRPPPGYFHQGPPPPDPHAHPHHQHQHPPWGGHPHHPPPGPPPYGGPHHHPSPAHGHRPPFDGPPPPGPHGSPPAGPPGGPPPGWGGPPPGDEWHFRGDDHRRPPPIPPHQPPPGPPPEDHRGPHPGWGPPGQGPPPQERPPGHWQPPPRW